MWWWGVLTFFHSCVVFQRDGNHGRGWEDLVWEHQGLVLCSKERHQGKCRAMLSLCPAFFRSTHFWRVQHSWVSQASHSLSQAQVTFRSGTSEGEDPWGVPHHESEETPSQIHCFRHTMTEVVWRNGGALFCSSLPRSSLPPFQFSLSLSLSLSGGQRSALLKEQRAQEQE